MSDSKRRLGQWVEIAYGSLRVRVRVSSDDNILLTVYCLSLAMCVCNRESSMHLRYAVAGSR
jgi:hypothetical protein